MKLEHKLTGLNVFGQTVFAVVFFSAVYLSYTAIIEKMQKTSLLERYSDDALDTYIILHLAETGDQEGNKETLNLKQDNYVYEIYQLSKEAEPSNLISELLRKMQSADEHIPEK